MSGLLSPIYGQSAYTLTKLTPPGSYFSEAYAINDSGWVTLRMTATATSPQAAYVYNDGNLTGIGDLPGGLGNFPRTINNLGEVAGSISFPGDGSHEHAYLFSGGVVSDLGTLPNGSRTLAYGINDSAQIAGYVAFGDGTQHAFLYANDVMADLGTLGGTESVAEGVNAAGNVVGYSSTAARDIIHAFVYREGSMTDLFDLTAGRALEATAINNQNEIVGRARSNHAFVYRDGLYAELGTLGGSFSSAYALNDGGQVVGYASAADASAHAFLYGPETGMIDLNSVVTLSDGVTPGFLSLNTAKGINARGQIVGTGIYFDGSARSTQAFLLTPVTQAATPTFSPAGGTFVGSQVVTISTTTSGATIRYTTDGSMPSETSGAIYVGPLNFSGSVTLMAIAFAPGYRDSPVASATYTIALPSAVAPVFSPGAGKYAGTQVVTLTTATAGAAIRYTMDGSTPTETNGTLYAGSPVVVSATSTLKAISYGTSFADSPVSSGLYIISSSPAASLNVVHDLAASDNGGAHPYAGLLETGDGSFFGTTAGDSLGQHGTVFQVTPAGVLTTLVSFNGANGTGSTAALVQGGDGNLYGTTGSGGDNSYGTVFQMTPSGALTTLVSFGGDNGAIPFAGVIPGRDGNFYGTTQYGGNDGWGTVFMMTPSGALTTMAAFNADNGAVPRAGLVQGSDGNFYGTTLGGGSAGIGTVFAMTPAGVVTTLVSFNDSNGASPQAGLVQGSDGNFYGTASNGGSFGSGTVFRITPAGALTTLVSFNGANGSYPLAPLIQASDGNFYGTTADGGPTENGTVFQMTPAGVLITLVSFNGTNGAHPSAGLVQAGDGSLYGTTMSGGASGDGVIFQLIVPPPTLALEAENLAYLPIGACALVHRDCGASGGKWVELAANGIGDLIRFRFHVAQAGRYQLSLRWKGGNDRGILNLKVDGQPLGSSLDQFSNNLDFRATEFGLVDLTPGDHFIQLVVAGRRRSSRGFTISADKFTLVGQ